ncbi:hypothetical protein I309_06480 [Cryptococcus deuterogattii LA55]|nr:hypothetical protein I309_06480 [Cryptococcus deuterogattii LA55]KIR91207.1 hypothetical protein I304_04674 [Cryptococcus deuterogattii CBS 10090]
MADHAAAPVPLHLPAILQNPTNRAARQVEAHNAQQREKAAARRERDSRSNWTPEYDGKGKRVIRRLDNGSIPFLSSADYTPPVPLQARPLRPSFPAGTIPRSTPVPPALIPERDPFSPDSRQGSFSTSLKGTRAMLRKRGKRAEGLVTKADTEIRKWLGGEWGDLNAQKDGQWRAIDERLVDYAFDISGAASLSSTGRRLPTHRGLDALPDLPIENGQIPAILEFSRSPAHLSWYLAESFDRLVVHLLSRYYELASWSQDLPTASGQILRVTHVVVPSIAQPNRHPIPGHSLATPETSDISGQSSSENSYHSLSEGESSGLSEFTESDSDTATEMGDAEVVGYSSIEEGDTTVMPIPEMSDLSLSENENELTRTFSATSSRYASSEGGSDFGTLGDSLTIPRISGHESEDSMAGGWVDMDDESDFGDIPGFSRVKMDAMYNRINPGVRVSARGWENKPTFFEYLYGV